jgi:F0F1-type ATP synthase delta subunit
MSNNQESRELSSSLARRYAQAFLSIYREELTAHACERLLFFKQFLVTNSALIYLFTIPSIDAKTKEQGLGFLAQKFELPTSFYSLMVLLLVSRRISLLPQVLCSLVALYKKENGIQAFTIHSSHVLSERDLEQLRDFLTQQIRDKQEDARDHHNIPGKNNIKVVCSYKQDKNLIAGIRMQSQTYLWEHSIEQQLREIELLLVR